MLLICVPDRCRTALLLEEAARMNAQQSAKRLKKVLHGWSKR